MIRHYILDENREPVEVDLHAWGEWMETHDRHVDDTPLFDAVRVSTVFLGLDHNFWERGPPMIFETMVFGSGTELDGEPYRCTTWVQAQAQHDQMVEAVKEAVRQRLER